MIVKAGKDAWYPVFAPDVVPYKGMKTEQDPYALSNGEFKVAKNIRCATEDLNVRAGITSLQNPPTTGTFRGAYLWETTSAGSNYTYLFMALDVSSKTRIYRNQSIDGGAWGGWFEMTAGSGKYGDSRRTPATGYGFFQVVTSPLFGSPRVVYQSGLDEPISGSVDMLSAVMAEMVTVEPPKWASDTSPILSISDALVMTSGSGSTTVATSGGSFTSPTGGNDWDITAATTGTAGNTVTVYQDATTVDFTNASQVWFVCTFTDESFFSNVKWSLRDSGGVFTVVNDPANGAEYSIIATDTPNVYLVSMPIDTGNPPTNINGVKLEVVTSAGITSGAVLKIWGILASGNVPGGATWGVAYRNSGSGVESQGVVMTFPLSDDVKYTQARHSLVVLGGTPKTEDGVTGTTVRDDFTTTNSKVFKLPLDSSLNYYVKVPLWSPISTQGALGVDRIDLYRKDFDSEDFYRVGEFECAEYTAGAWTFKSPWTGWNQKYLAADNSAPENLDYKIFIPSGSNESPSQGTAMAVSGRRFCVAKASTTNTPVSSVAISAVDFPFRFQPLPDAVNPNLGYENLLAVGDDATAIVASSASAVGSSALFVFTRNRLYSMVGLGVRPVASLGTNSPHSVCERSGAVYFVDHERVQRRVVVSPGTLSLNNVQDVLDGVSVTNLAKVQSLATRNRVYTVIPGSPNKTLVYSEFIGAYESLDQYHTSAPKPVFFLAWPFGGSSRILTFDTLGELYAYESGANDDGQLIPVELQPGTVRGVGKMNLTMKEVMALCTDQAITLTMVRTNYLSSTAVNTTLTLPGTATYAWVTDQANASRAAATGRAATFNISASVSYPFSFKEIGLIVSAEDGLGARTP